MEEDKVLSGTVDQTQIAAWKEKHGEIIAVELEDKVCYLRKPDRKGKDVLYARGATGKFEKTFIEQIWLGGDEAIKEEAAYFLPLYGMIDKIIGLKVAELKNL
jgi:hypothetical protein